jgi:hypothetical protein
MDIKFFFFFLKTLGEELDAILAREQLIHYMADMIATKAKRKYVWKKM